MMLNIRSAGPRRALPAGEVAAEQRLEVRLDGRLAFGYARRLYRPLREAAGAPPLRRTGRTGFVIVGAVTIKKMIWKAVRKVLPSQGYDHLYEGSPYLEAYSKHTDMRVSLDPKGAVGGLWEEIGKLQIDFLTGEGMQPTDTLLDLGCGTLRGGRHFINYLDTGKYCGIDISGKAIEAARELVEREGLADKQPELIHNPDGDLKFDEFQGRTFDFIMAQSVFTHLREEHIRECLENVHKALDPRSKFYFTFVEADQPLARICDFSYPFAFFGDLAAENGLHIVNRSDRYPHPRNQRIAYVELA
jgi:SAM-dependent methyltransferase